MTPFVEVRIEDGLVIYATQGGPEFSTAVVSSNSGSEFRNAVWEDGLSSWELGDRKLNSDDLASLLGFFRARKGKAQGFRLKDWSDFQATAIPKVFKNSTHQGVLGTIGGPFGIGNSILTYNTFKSYTSGGETSYRQIKKLVSIQPYRNDVALVLDTDYSVDINTGLVTFIGTPPIDTDVLTWDGEFDIPVRFDVDQIKHRFDSAEVIIPGTQTIPAVLGIRYFYINTLPLVELRNP